MAEIPGPSVSLTGVPARLIDDLWPSVKDQIARSQKHGDGWKVEDVYRGLKDRDMQLWLVVGDHKCIGVGVTEIRIGKEKVCHIFSLSGVHWDQWKHLLEPVKEWAKSLECQKITMSGRPGWMRKLKGWTLSRVEMELTI